MLGHKPNPAFGGGIRMVHGELLGVLRRWPTNSVDCAFCDPPYGIAFKGNDWDCQVPPVKVWGELHRVLKPGGHLLAFGGPTSWHRLACNVEDAGFLLMGPLLWLFGNGMPKGGPDIKMLLAKAGAVDVADRWEGYRTRLKPAYNPIVWAMKASDGRIADNALKHGIAGINIAGCGIPCTDKTRFPVGYADTRFYSGSASGRKRTADLRPDFRYPTDVLLDEAAAEILGDNARFFYCGRASAAEKTLGLETGRKNDHPCLKPIELCTWLAKLILPPKRETPRRLIVPFAGTGSEVIGAIRAGWEDVCGIELNQGYMEIAFQRIPAWVQS